MNEPDLIRAAQSGDLEAFNQLVLAHQDKIFNTAWRILGDDDLAADVSQDAFITAFRKLAGYRGGAFGGWLARIAINLCYDALRSQKRRPTQQLEVESGDGREFDSSAWLADPAPGPEQKIEACELACAIQDGLNALPAEFRAVIVLVDVDELDYEEVADILRIPLGTVKSRLARARLHMREHLRGLGELSPGALRPAQARSAGSALPETA